MKMALRFLWRGMIQLHQFRKIDEGRRRSLVVPVGSNGAPPANFKAGPRNSVPNGLDNFGTRVLFRVAKL